MASPRLASRIPVRTGGAGPPTAFAALPPSGSPRAALRAQTKSSESDGGGSRHSIDSVQLAQVLDASADNSIKDELPPFSVDDPTRARARNGDSERPRVPEERRDVTTSPNTLKPTPQRPSGFPDTGARKRGTALPHQNTNSRNPPQSRTRPIGIAASSRQRKPNTATMSATAAGRTKHSASAHELSRIATGATTSSSPSSRTPGGGGRTKKPLPTAAIGNDLPTSSSTHSLSHHYPAEAYLIPQITEYRPPEGTDWDHTVIPTIARRMGDSGGGGGRGRVGLGFFHEPISQGNTQAEAEIVSEWTKEGPPAPAKNVQVGMDDVQVGMDDVQVGMDHVHAAAANDDNGRAEEVEKQPSQADERDLDGVKFVHNAHDGNDLDEAVEPVERETHPSSSSAEGEFERTHGRGESVLSDLLAEYTQETSVPSATDGDADAGDDGGSLVEGRLTAGEGPGRDVDEDITGFKADEQSSTEEPAQKQQEQPFSDPQKQSTTTAAQTTDPAARLPIRGLPRSQTRDVPVPEPGTSSGVKVSEDSSGGRKAPVVTPPPPPRKGVEEGHGAGCRCILM
ncbi:hypothetical protein QFC19_006470 [Naganishia cerealis]|uniref:Uncharacterized protein n=1 Tax=Naganishia cerealis TaxID=610337 RepID=A0ACC2VGY5_9TREE|nr:hypothetical protein QFC19_006470 [Naganishia cerealis]